MGLPACTLFAQTTIAEGRLDKPTTLTTDEQLPTTTVSVDGEGVLTKKAKDANGIDLSTIFDHHFQLLIEKPNGATYICDAGFVDGQYVFDTGIPAPTGGWAVGTYKVKLQCQHRTGTNTFTDWYNFQNIGYFTIVSGGGGGPGGVND